MSGPLPVVYVSAKLANGLRWCIYQANVFDFEQFNAEILESAMKGGDPAAMTWVGLTGSY